MPKLDKMQFAFVLAHCVSNGMNTGAYEVEELNRLIEVDAPVNSDPRVPETWVNDLLVQMLNQQKIPAIKAYHTLTGAGLKEAKDAVERYWYPDKYSKTELLQKAVEYTDNNRCNAEAIDLIGDFIRSLD